MKIHSSSLGKINNYIEDRSGVLNPNIKSKYSNKFKKLYLEENGSQVVTILFPHRKGKELKNIGVDTFNENGIGDSGKNNGLLLLIATDEKKIRIIVGKGLENIYTRDVCKWIIKGKLRPLIEGGRYNQLLMEWYNIINQREKSGFISDNQFSNTDDLNLKKSDIKNFFLLFLVFLGVYYMIGSISISNMLELLKRHIYISLILMILGFIIYNTRSIRIGFYTFISSIVFIFLVIITPNICDNYNFDRSSLCENIKLEGEIRKSIRANSKNNTNYKYSGRNTSSDSSSYSNYSSGGFFGGGGITIGGGRGD